jgi:endonuclease G
MPTRIFRHVHQALVATVSAICDASTVVCEDAKPDLKSFSPVSSIRILRPNPNLEIAFDVRTRNPVYVLERIQLVDNAPTKRRQHFFEEASLPEAFRSRNSSYHQSGFDRGHLAPAGDFSGQHKSDTFTLCNVSPQDPSLNRQLWVRLEDWVRRVARYYKDHDTYVLTGPLWMPSRQISDKVFEFQYKAIGTPPCIVSVPTHFFKVIVVVDTRAQHTIVQFACFVVPNAETQGNVNLEDYLVRWSDLEAVAGLEMFPALATNDWKILADKCVPYRTSQPQLLLENGRNSTTAQQAMTKRSKIVGHLCQNGFCKIGAQSHNE